MSGSLSGLFDGLRISPLTVISGASENFTTSKISDTSFPPRDTSSEGDNPDTIKSVWRSNLVSPFGP